MRTVRAVLAVALVGIVSACNAILGNESNYTLVTGDAGNNGCTLNSDCSGGRVCLFATCSKPCANDADCPNEARCLRTDTKAGTACVSATQASCASGKCPTGTVCHAGECRNECAVADDCSTDQNCADGVCRGTDPKHDPTGGTDSGAGGQGGGTSTGGQGGQGGQAGMIMSSGGAGGNASGGTAGSVGIMDSGLDTGTGTGGAGPIVDGGGDGGPVDNTRIGTPGEPCAPANSYACAGHAQRGILTCTKGVWTALTPCAGNNFCDSTPGANAGSCQPVVAQCAGKTAGTQFCQSTKDLYECGIDLVTTKLVETCPYVCSNAACGGECDPAGSVTKQCKSGTNIPQTCDATGTWKDGTACSYLCKDGDCVAASCGDTVKNGDETDTDCGGSCSGCAVNGVCKINGDCKLPVSGKCTGGKCAAAACNDGVQNGSESDIDCGGSCTGCAVTKACGTNSDCILPASGKCTNGKCASAACNDGVQNGSETAPDCGGTCPSDCPVGSACGTNADCALSACVSGICTGVCSPGTKQCSLVGAGGVQTCGADGQWGNAVACSQSQTCASGACVACPAGTMDCDSTASNGCEKAINTAASCGTSCATVTCSSANGNAPVCVNGNCGITSCKSGYGDCNAGSGVNDGCETFLWADNACGPTCANRPACSDPAAPTCVGGACTCPQGNTVSNGVCCQVGLVGCGNRCVDLQGDNSNCGACGLSCATGCKAGRCVVTIASEGTNILQGIAVDATNVYYTNIIKQVLEKVSINGTGGAGSPYTMPTTAASGPFAVAVDTSAAYWTTEGGGGIFKATIGSSFVSTLATGQSGANGIATDGVSVYWAGSTIAKVSVTGGTVQTLATPPAGGFGIALAGGQVYYSIAGDASANGFIARVPAAGGSSVTLRSGLFEPASLAVDGTNIYWGSSINTSSDSANIFKMPIGGGTPVPLATGTNYFLDGTIALDGGFVYWANFTSAPNGSILKVPVGGGPVITLASGLASPISVAVSGNSAYFTTYTGTVGKITPK